MKKTFAPSVYQEDHPIGKIYKEIAEKVIDALENNSLIKGFL